MRSRRILFFSHAVPGHLHPLAALAEEVVRRGHDVAFHVRDEAVPLLHRAGVRKTFSCPEADPEAASPEAIGRDDLSSALARALVLPALAELPSAIEALRAFRPEVTVCDPVVYRGVIASQLHDVPYAVASTTLLPAIEAETLAALLPPLQLQPALETLWRRCSAEPPRFVRSQAVSPWLNAVFATAAFVGQSKDLLLAGPVIFRDRDDRNDVTSAPRIIYMSFGTLVRHEDDVFHKTFRAVAGAPWHLLVAAGDAAARLQPLAPANVTVVEQVPQLRVLERADLAITHGGANTTAECLFHGVPMLVSPITFDQPVQAHLVEQRGAGRSIDLRTASVDEIRETIAAMLTPSGAAPHLGTIQQSYRDANGPATFADAVERLAA